MLMTQSRARPWRWLSQLREASRASNSANGTSGIVESNGSQRFSALAISWICRSDKPVSTVSSISAGLNAARSCNCDKSQ